MRTVRLQVRMRDVVPHVVRVVDVPASVTLPELHDLLQVAVGWTDSHLHQFVVGPSLRTRRRGPDDEVTVLYTRDFGEGFELDDVAGVREVDETGVRLRDLPAQFVYAYDLGDGWEHDVEVLGPGADRPGLVSGQGNCPPEDCGGVPGYEELLAAAAGELRTDDADPEWVELLKAHAGQIRVFDRDAVDDLVRRTAGLVPASVRLLLDLTAEGVKLTPGGRLPRWVVRAVQEQRPDWYPLGRPASVEEDLPPLSELDDLMCQVGILRITKGVLKPIKVVQGPNGDTEVVRRLRSWLPPESFTHMLAGNILALLAVEGPLPLEQLAATAHAQLGRGWSTASGAPVQVSDVLATLRGLRHELRGLDLVETRHRNREDIWSAGPSATSLLPRATALADIWACGTDHP